MSEHRQRLPTRRRSRTWSFRVGGQRVYVSTSTDYHGRCRELFLRVGRCGTAMAAVLDATAILASLALQHGAPVEQVARVLSGVDCQPQGQVRGLEGVGVATSILDAVAQLLVAEHGEASC